MKIKTENREYIIIRPDGEKVVALERTILQAADEEAEVLTLFNTLDLLTDTDKKEDKK
jgi:hypothetical protein